MKPASKIILWITTALLACGFIAASATSAFAQGSGNQWNYRGGFINAWGGGPFVKVYQGGGVVNNDFTLINNAGGWQLEFTGHGYSGYCVGDAYNDPNNGYTSLDPCGGVGGGPAGWGTLFDISQPCGKGEYVFHNRHWNGYLDVPQNFTTGDEFVLNNKTLADCFYFAGPA